MKGVYPVFIKEYGDDYLVYVPDFDAKTEGHDFFDAIHMARDVISLTGISYQDAGRSIPTPSDREAAMKMAEEDADEILDFTDGTLTFVDADFDEYRKSIDHRSVKKNCTIPYWMSVEADKRCVNYSKVLQDALDKIIAVPQNG